MKFQNNQQTDDSLLVDISDALSERDRVRFTVHTRTKLPQFSKPVLSVVRQHEEFIWLHDCLVENDQYAGYIIPPPPPKPDFDSSREKLQRLGDCENNLTKEEFAKMKQELESEYLAIFKKTVAMHEIFLQRLASHDKFRGDNNFKIFLEYENELAVRGKSKREKLAGSISNIGKSLTDFVITTSQVANSNSISNIASGVTGSSSISNYMNNINYNSAAPSLPPPTSTSINNSYTNYNNNVTSNNNNNNTTSNNDSAQNTNNNPSNSASSNNSSDVSGANTTGNSNSTSNSTTAAIISSSNSLSDANDEDSNVDEQYFEKERLFLALYYNGIKETALCADRVSQAHKCVAESYLNIAQQLVKLASIEVVPITSKTIKDISSSGFIAGPLPSLTLPSLSTIREDVVSSHEQSQNPDYGNNLDYDDDNVPSSSSSSKFNIDENHSDTRLLNNSRNSNSNNKKDKSTGGCANDHTSEGLKRLLLNVSDYMEQGKKVEARVATDEDLKLTDTFLYYKRDTVAAQDLLTRRMRFMAEYENATKNLEKAHLKGKTVLYADVIQKQAKENFISISKLAKQELIDYKKRRVSSFKKAFSDLAELEIKHLKAHSQLISNCLSICRGEMVSSQPATASTPAAGDTAANSTLPIATISPTANITTADTPPAPAQLTPTTTIEAESRPLEQP